MKTLIKNVKIITPYRVLQGYNLVIKDGKIFDIDREDNLNPKDYQDIIDGEGDYLSPGFVDIHNHGNSGYDIMDAREEALDSMGQYHISNGVTAYIGTIITSSFENMVNAIENIVNHRNKEDKAQIWGIHLEGPYFNVDKKGAQPEEYIKLPNLQDMEKIIEMTQDKLKMVSLAPELPGALDIIGLLKGKGITVAMAHSNGNYEDTKKAIEFGATVATHLYNGMREFSHREPGIIGASLTDDRVYCEIIYDRVHLHDIAVKIALKMKGTDKVVLVSDAMMAAGLDDGEYDLGGQKVNVRSGEARLESGSLAGSTLNLQEAVYNMVNHLQIPIYEVVKMASLTPAKAINLHKHLGSIEIGKRADLIIFDQDINIEKVILGGNLAWKES